MYAYRRDFLLEFTSLPQTPLERTESLEQLRALEHGVRIRTVHTQYESIEVDTPEDLERARRLIAAPARV
jgi:3-deoxy-manno-octulosonate cytidylyltransferase (CMP-KDO synthetase)